MSTLLILFVLLSGTLVWICNVASVPRWLGRATLTLCLTTLLAWLVVAYLTAREANMGFWATAWLLIRAFFSFVFTVF